MAVTWETFERYRQKGLDARRAMQWDIARQYLLEAARAMTELAKQAEGEELRSGRQDIARKLLELAKDCEQAKKENRRTPSMRGGGGCSTAHGIAACLKVKPFAKPSAHSRTTEKPAATIPPTSVRQQGRLRRSSASD